MVARNSDSARGVNERFKDQSKKHEELVRSVGRGSSALRSASDAILEMDPEAGVPILKSGENNIGLLFRKEGDYNAEGQLEIVDETGSNFKNLKAGGVISNFDVNAGRNINVNGAAAIGGNLTVQNVYPRGELITGQGIRANGGLSCAGAFGVGLGATIGLGLKVGDAENPVGGRITNREMTTEGNIFVKGNIYYNGTLEDLQPSERRLKDTHKEITDGLSIIEKLKVGLWSYKKDFKDDGRRHIGIYVDELAEIAPDAIVDPPDLSQMPTEDTSQFDGEARNYENRAIIGFLVAAVQQLNDIKNANEKRMVQMQTDIDDLKESVRLLNEQTRQ